MNLYAKERRGTKLLITKKGGQQVGGELIAVKQDSLLLLTTEGKDVSVGVVDVKACISPGENFFDQGRTDELFPKQQREDLMSEKRRQYHDYSC